MLGSEAQVIFPAFSAVKPLSLLTSKIPDERCAAPAEWSVDLSLVSMPPEMTLMPVYEGEEIEQPTVVEIQPETDAASEETEEGTSMSDVSFAIDRVAKLDDGYLVVGHVQWSDERWENIWVSAEDLEVSDSSDKRLPVESSEESTQDNHFAFKIKGLAFQPPLTIKIKSLYVWSRMEDGPAISFDAGDRPQVGQSWEMNRELDVQGQKILLRNVRVVESETQENLQPQAYGMPWDTKRLPKWMGSFSEYKPCQKITGRR